MADEAGVPCPVCGVVEHPRWMRVVDLAVGVVALLVAVWFIGSLLWAGLLTLFHATGY